MPNCEIKIKDNLLSKYQGFIKYVFGNGYDGKPSTNSNWYQNLLLFL